MSIVFYKFKSAKDFDTCTFDGAGISVFDLKREIMFAKKLGKGQDFDLALHNAQTKEEYTNDTTIISRNSSVLVSRNPPSRPGKGTAQRYLSAAAAPIPTTTSAQSFGGGRGKHMHHSNAPGGHMAVRPMSLNNVARPPGSDEATIGADGAATPDRISLMFKQEADQWKETQDRMAVQRPIFRPTMGRGRGFIPPPGEQRPPPAGYICYRCGQREHYINMCPTIGDKDFDNRPKLKRTTGIPKMFLKTIEIKDPSSGIMVTQTGEFVVAQPNDEAWIRQNAQRRTHVGAGDVYEMAPVLPGFECLICQKLLRDAVSTTCCNSNFCDECIRLELLEPQDPLMKFKCPVCGSDQVPDQLLTNKTLRQQVQSHLHEFATMSNGVAGETGDSVATGDAGSHTPAQSTDMSLGVSDAKSAENTGTLKTKEGARHISATSDGNTTSRPIESANNNVSVDRDEQRNKNYKDNRSGSTHQMNQFNNRNNHGNGGRSAHGNQGSGNRNVASRMNSQPMIHPMAMMAQFGQHPFMPLSGMPPMALQQQAMMQGMVPNGFTGMPFRPPSFPFPPNVTGFPSMMMMPSSGAPFSQQMNGSRQHDYDQDSRQESDKTRSRGRDDDDRGDLNRSKRQRADESENSDRNHYERNTKSDSRRDGGHSRDRRSDRGLSDERSHGKNEDSSKRFDRGKKTK
ncbi:Protein mpe1 [Batrachochytrium dendrobatidis]